MKLKEIPRTATFAWTHDAGANTLVTGTASGAIDADFNSNTQLELWKTDQSEPVFSTEVDARFHDLVVSKDNKYVAGAMENGIVNVWKYQKDSLVSAGSGSNHKAAARAVAFNAENKLVSAGNNGELFVWDLEGMKAEAPGPSSRQDDIVGVAWNNRVNQILATAGTGGFTSIWDLRKHREVIHLHYTVAGSRLPASSVSWHASNSTKLVTSSSDDQNPVVLVWDLRNANSPEVVLEGHSAGVLSVDWCLQDPDLLLSSGKDNRTLLWNPTKQSLLAEYPISVGWTFKTRFNPRVPDIFASASFDGKLSVQTLQDTSEPKSDANAKASGDAFWDSEEVADAVHPQFHAHQAPAWLKRPVSASFGFGGKLVTVTSKGVEITTIKASATDVSSLKTAFESKNYASLADTKDDKDWELLKLAVSGEPLYKGENAEIKDENEEDADDDFVVSKDYQPSGEYKLFDGKHDKITKLVLAGKISKAVDVLIDEGSHADALLLASYDPELLTRARNAYLEASKKPFTRAAWASQGNLSDFENVELDAWKDVLSLVHSDGTKTRALGQRLHKAGRRDDALRVYLAGNNISDAGSIWLEELPAAEKRYSSDKKNTAYQAHTKALQEVIEKLTVASKGTAIQDADAALYDTYRDFANIVASQGDLDLASTLLDLLPSTYAQDKGRITGATNSKKQVKKTASSTASKYGQPAVIPGYGAPKVAPVVPSPVAAPGVSPSVPKTTGNRPPAPVVQTPVPTQAAAAPRPLNPYAPAGATASPAVPKNPYAAAVGAVPAPVPAAPTPVAPPKAGSGKVSSTIRPPQHGWNDLPEMSMQNSLKNRRTPTAPPIIPNQYVDKSKSIAPPSRAPSTGPSPPPKTGSPLPPSAHAQPAAPAANPYAPPPGAAPRTASPYAPAGPATQAIPGSANPYAPVPGAAAAAAAAPSPARAPAPALKAAPAPPPPGKARSAIQQLPAAVAASLPVDDAPAAETKPKYPAGDREHIPTEAKPIYKSLSKAVEAIRPTISAQFPKQMKDTERRINILFDHLNNEDLFSAATVEKLVNLSSALDAREFDRAEEIRNDIATHSPEESGTWMTGMKRLVQMASAINPE